MEILTFNPAALLDSVIKAPIHNLYLELHADSYKNYHTEYDVLFNEFDDYSFSVDVHIDFTADRFGDYEVTKVEVEIIEAHLEGETIEIDDATKSQAELLMSDYFNIEIYLQ